MSGNGEQIWKAVAAMVFINFAVATVNVLMKKVLNEGVDHMVIVTYRMTVSTIFLAPIAYYWERKTRPRLTGALIFYHFFGALFGTTLTQFFFLMGMKHTSAAFSCAFLNMMPVNTFILALIFGLEKVNMKSKAGRAKVFGALICVGGVIILTFYKGFPLPNPHLPATTQAMISDNKTRNWIIGSMLLIAGSFVWSSWFLIQAKIFKSYPCQYSSTVIMSFFSVIQSATLCAIIRRNTSMWILEAKLEIIAVIYAGIIGSCLCTVGISWYIKQNGPIFTSAFSPFIQIFAAMLDYSILHDDIYFGSVMGSIFVVLGLYILLWGKNKEGGIWADDAIQQIEEDKNCKVDLPVTATSNSRNP